MVSQAKWDKTKLLIAELGEMIPKGPLPLQRLLEIRGFLIYVVWMYTWLNPYIKGWVQVDSKGETSDAVPRNGGGRPAMSKGVQGGGDPGNHGPRGDGRGSAGDGDPSKLICSGFELPARTHFECRAPKTTLPGRPAGHFLRVVDASEKGKGNAVWSNTGWSTSREHGM